MSETARGVYYPDKYDVVADVPADFKKMAESVDKAIENSEYDDATIKQDISTNAENINKNTTSIETLESDNTNIKESISTNAENIQKNTDSINSLQQSTAESIDKLKAENEALKSQIPTRTSKW